MTLTLIDLKKNSTLKPCFWSNVMKNRLRKLQGQLQKKTRNEDTSCIRRFGQSKKRSNSLFMTPGREIQLFLQGPVKTSVDYMTTSIFSKMCWMTICLKKKYFDSEETLKSASTSLSSQDQFLQQERSIAEKTSEEEIHSCGKYSFFG